MQHAKTMKLSPRKKRSSTTKTQKAAMETSLINRAKQSEETKHEESSKNEEKNSVIKAARRIARASTKYQES